MDGHDSSVSPAVGFLSEMAVPSTCYAWPRLVVIRIADRLNITTVIDRLPSPSQTGVILSNEAYTDVMNSCYRSRVSRSYYFDECLGCHLARFPSACVFLPAVANLLQFTHLNRYKSGL